MSYSGNSFTSSFTIFAPTPNVTTSDSSYYNLVLPKIEIYDNIGSTLLVSYNGFESDSATINLIEYDLNLSSTQPTFSLTFEDNDKMIDQTKIGIGNKVRILASKDGINFTHLLTGYTETRSPNVNFNGDLIYTISGFGEKASLNDLIINFRRASSSVEQENELIVRPDSQMTVHELIRDIFEDTDIRVTGNRSVKDYLNLDLSGINANVNEFIASINKPLSEVTNVIKFLLQISGANLEIKDGRVILEYPQLQHSGIIVKNIKESHDKANATSYFVGPWSYTDSISKSDGFANRIVVATTSDTKTVASNLEGQNGATILYNTILGQQFQALDTRFSSIALVLSKIGQPFPDTDIADQVVKGEIRVHDDINNQPGPVIAEFKVPSSRISETSDTILVNNININSTVSSPSAKYWIILRPVGTSPSNTIRWHHNSNFSKPNQISAIARIINSQDPIDWRVSNYGPTYNFNVFSRIRRLQEYSDPGSISKFRLKERIIDLSFLDDPLSVVKASQAILGFMSKPVRKYNPTEITIPNEKFFFPGQYITIVDGVGGHPENRNIIAEVTEARYSGSGNNDTSVGTMKCKIKAIALVDWHIDELPC
ncbi:MAG: hypothetical protein ACPKPY_05560 [Nitrososphaeraceae archaeon]